MTCPDSVADQYVPEQCFWSRYQRNLRYGAARLSVSALTCTSGRTFPATSPSPRNPTRTESAVTDRAEALLDAAA